MLEGVERIKFDLPVAYVRAIRSRAGLDGSYPRDVVLAALDSHLAKEIAEAKERLARPESGPIKRTGKSKKKV